MQGLVLQLTRVGFLLLLWLFIWSVLRILRTDIYAPTGAVMVRRGLALRGSLLPNRGRRHVPRQLVVTEGALTGTRIPLGTQPVLIGRADDSTLVLTDDYASTRHARLSQRGSEWYVEDRSEEHTSELQSPDHLVCRLLLEIGRASCRERV